jgi:hypothetical protein
MKMNGAAKLDDAGASRTVCAVCRHCEHDRHVLEATIPGLISFGSGFGASVGETRLCRRHDHLISPGDTCGEFEADSLTLTRIGKVNVTCRCLVR